MNTGFLATGGKVKGHKMSKGRIWNGKKILRIITENQLHWGHKPHRRYKNYSAARVYAHEGPRRSIRIKKGINKQTTSSGYR